MLSKTLLALVLYFAVFGYVERVPQLPSSREFNCLVKNIYYEARGESFLGKVAVGEVTLNRVGKRPYAKTICGVVYQRKQFSWTLKPQSARIDEQAWLECMRAATVAYNQHTMQATHYHNTKVNPAWGLQRLFKIGQHIFYK